MNKSNILRTCYLLLLFCFLAPLGAYAETTSLYKELKNLPANKIYEKGLHFRHKENKPDEALACFTVLKERFGNKEKGPEAELVIKAYSQMAYIYFFHYFDYTSAFSYINLANNLAEKTGKNPVEMPLYTGLIYSSLAQQSRDEQTTDDALKFLHQAFDRAEEEDNDHMLNIAFTNLLILTSKSDRLNEVMEEWRRYKIHEIEKHDPQEAVLTRFNHAAFEGLGAIGENRMEQAIDKFNDILTSIPNTKENLRYTMAALEFKIDTYLHMGDFDKALKEIDKAMDLASKYQMKEAMLDFYRIKAEIFEKTGNTEAQMEAKTHYLEIKDSLLNFREVANIEQLKALNEIKKAEQSIHEANCKRRNLMILMWGLGGLMIVVVVFAYLLYRKNRQLKGINRSLFEKNEQYIKFEGKERDMRKEYQQQIDALKQRLEETNTTEDKTDSEAAIPDAEYDASATDEKDTPCECEGECDCEENKKYKNSSLSEEFKANLVRRIEEVMDNNDEIYNPDFSLQRLSEILNTNYKYVSQAINETYGFNFNSLLSDYRINEACRRLSDTERFGNVTIEGLSLDLGFKSRTTFVLQFKKRTGLNPSQYQKEAQTR